jgi:hypothetical protein
MRTFQVIVRTAGQLTQYPALAQSSADAFDQAAARFADVPCGITVLPGRPS